MEDTQNGESEQTETYGEHDPRTRPQEVVSADEGVRRQSRANLLEVAETHPNQNPLAPKPNGC